MGVTSGSTSFAFAASDTRANGAGDEHDKHDKKRARSSQSDVRVFDAEIAKVLCDAGDCGMTVKDIVTKLPGSTYNAVHWRLRRSNVFRKLAPGVWSCADAFGSPEAFKNACDAAEDAQVNDAEIAKVLRDAGDCGMTVKDIVTKLPGSTSTAVDGRLRRSNVFGKLAPGVWSCADAFESPEAFKIACDAAEDALSKDFSWGGDEDANGKRYEDKVILTHRVARGEVLPPAGTPAVSPSLHFRRGQTASLPEVIARSNLQDFGPSVHNLSLSKVFGKAIDEVFDAIEASPREPPTNGLLIIPGWERACRSVHTKTLREMRDNAVAGKLCALEDLIVDCLERNKEIVKRLAKHKLKVQDIICSHIEDKTFFKSDGKSRARHGHGHRAGVSKSATAPHQDHGVNPVTFSARRALPDVRTINGVRYVFGRLPDWYVRHMESAFKNPSYANGSSIEARARHRSVVEKLVYELNDSERPSYGFVMDSAENAYFTHGVENDNGEAWSMMQIVLDGGVDYETMRLIAQDLREASGDVLQPTRREVVSPKTKDLTTKDANEQKYTGLPLPVVAAADEDDDEDEDEDEDDDDDDDEDEDEDEDDEDDEDDDDDDDDDDVPLSCWVSGV